MTNTPEIFNNSTLDATIQVLKIEGEPWFVAKDAAHILGLRRAGRMTGIIGWLADGEHQYVMKSNVHLMDGRLPNRGVICVSESGFYKLIMRSDKLEAIQFQDWVTREVLPAIRKDGSYSARPRRQ